MSYFRIAYEHLRFPISENNLPGLRRAQLGAIHAIGAHFSLPQSDPGLVVMPTGSGKTAVIALAAYVLRAERVLILTPSQLVRTQIADQMCTMSVLKLAKVLPEDYPVPRVKEIKHRMATEDLWGELREVDLVVTTPQCVSPGIEGIAKPPDGLFDLILMDEAHHSEAPRWADILEHFSSARRLLFTATPFRRDKKELKARIVYNYPLRLAHQDGIFGNLRFVPVEPATGTSHDSAIAKTAQQIYREDQNAGLNHRLMVRTDSKPRADELAKLYSEVTDLRLALVYSGHAMSTIKKVLARLNSGELDGIICVAMMGEGFDFPSLKIAAVHTPHKSLAVTLQFIGRFARTTGANLGEAKFIAVPQDIQAETDELYRESAAWQDIVSNLSAARIEHEVRIKEVAGSFTALQDSETDVSDVVVTDFKPYFHVKIYQLEAPPVLAELPTFPAGVTVLRHEISEEHNSSILLIRQVTRPLWTDLQQFSRIEYDLIVIHYSQTAKLLFINSSRRTLMFYKLFEDYYGKGLASLLSGPKINRVIGGLNNPSFFNIGLKNLVQNSNTESYQIKAGPSAHNSLTPTDGLLFRRGHVMGRGTGNNGQRQTIGYSSSSKVWSSYSARIGELIEWCGTLAEKLQKKGEVLTGTRLDSLSIGDELESLPLGVMGVGWPDQVFRDFPHVRLKTERTSDEANLLDCEISLVRENTTATNWRVRFEHESGASLNLDFSITDSRPVFDLVEGNRDVYVLHKDEEIPFLAYLSHFPLAFYLEDFSRVDGATLYRYFGGAGGLHADYLLSLPWKEKGVDIGVECSDSGLDVANPKTVQDFLGSHLLSEASDVIFFDHGAGEMADFITLTATAGNVIEVRLYHCKGSGGKDPGDRVGDAYEVCGQVAKCMIWLKNKEMLRTKILHRESTRDGSYFLKGNRNEVLRILGADTPADLKLAIYVVQPGIPIENISEKVSKILGAASHYILRAAGAEMYLIGSKT